MVFDSEALFGNFGYLLDTIFTFFLALIILLVTIFIYAKYGAKKSQETGRKALTENESVKAEKERENERKKEETGYSERDERGYENEDSEDSDDGE